MQYGSGTLFARIDLKIDIHFYELSNIVFTKITSRLNRSRVHIKLLSTERLYLGCTPLMKRRNARNNSHSVF